MSGAGLQLRLRGRSAAVACKGGGCHCDRRLVKGLKGSTKQLAVCILIGCSKFGVSTVSDLLERDGTHVRTESCGWGGEWTNQCRDMHSKSGQEWVTLMRTQLGVGVGCDHACRVPFFVLVLL
jgi:hypothetical protein